MAEKRKPTYDLNAIKAAFSSVNTLRATGAAIKGAAAMGLGRTDIVATIHHMRRRQFYKSMTSHADHRIWQDVYHVASDAGTIYVKFTADAATTFLLLSFKEKEND